MKHTRTGDAGDKLSQFLGFGQREIFQTAGHHVVEEKQFAVEYLLVLMISIVQVIEDLPHEFHVELFTKMKPLIGLDPDVLITA